jgi:hypothetical protein
MQNVDHNIGFREKRQFFRRKLAKIAENCDHNIDPWFTLKHAKQFVIPPDNQNSWLDNSCCS